MSLFHSLFICSVRAVVFHFHTCTLSLHFHRALKWLWICTHCVPQEAVSLLKFRSLSPQRQNYPPRASWFPPNLAPNSAKEHSQESGVTKSFPVPSASCSCVSPSCYRRHSEEGEVTDPALTYQIWNNPLAMYFSPQSPALHCSICPRDFFSSQVQTVFTHRSFPPHCLVFQGPFPLYRDVELPLCYFTVLMPSFSLCFFHLSLSFFPSFLLLYSSGSHYCLVCKKDILSIGFENSFTPQCIWLVFIMRVPFPNCSHSLLIISSGFVTQKFSVLGWFWSRFWFRFLYFFLDFLLPLDIIFFFLPLPKLHFIFLFSSVVLFSLFKTNFAIFVIDVDTLLIFTNSTEV